MGINEINMGLYYDPKILEEKIENTEDDKALREACSEFESIFLAKMFKEMRNTVPQGGLIERSTAMDIFEEMYIDELSKEIAKKDGGLGIAQMLYQQFKKGYISW